MKFLRFLFLGLIIFGIISPITYIYTQWAEKAWFPVGVADPKLITVTGDSWAITSDHHFYFQNERDKRKWWEGYPLENDEDSLIWGINEYGEAVISTSKGIHLRTHTVPAPSFYPTAVGGTYFCKDNSVYSTVFAITANQLAFYNYSEKKWQISVLSDFVTSPVVLPSRCQLFFLEGRELHYINLIFDHFINNENSVISEQFYNFAEYGGITAIATSGGNIWALTGSGDVLKIETDFSAEKFITWEVLPSPPQITNPVLISGIAGPTSFGTYARSNIDLWLKSDNETYWYNEELGKWEIFPFPYDKLASISSVTRSSEPFGDTITRLAIANGKVYRQYPVLSKLPITFLIFPLPILFLFSLFLSGIIMIKRSQTK
ncbi:MAG: hypothetical protein HUU38_02780 [Anaerolineales bacterium]|nr:hypothetical protein [Anaerolineales bacterium]